MLTTPLRSRAALVPASLALLLVSGCSAEPTSGAGPSPASGAASEPAPGALVPATSEPSPVAPVSPPSGVAADGGSYPTPQAVIDAMVAAGLSCEEPMSGTVEGVSAAASCILGGTEDAVVVRFGSDAEKQSFVDGKDPLSSIVVGQDWAVQTVLPDSARTVAAAVGGEVVAGSN